MTKRDATYRGYTKHVFSIEDFDRKHTDDFPLPITGGVIYCECICHIPTGTPQTPNSIDSCEHCEIIGG